MKTLYALVLGTALVTGTLPSFAGGPVVVEDRYDTEVEAAPKAKWVVPVAVGLIAACILLCGGGDDAPVAAPGPVCNGDGDGC